jgi:hypothetical protein
MRATHHLRRALDSTPHRGSALERPQLPLIGALRPHRKRPEAGDVRPCLGRIVGVEDVLQVVQPPVAHEEDHVALRFIAHGCDSKFGGHDAIRKGCRWNCFGHGDVDAGASTVATTDYLRLIDLAAQRTCPGEVEREQQVEDRSLLCRK